MAAMRTVLVVACCCAAGIAVPGGATAAETCKFRFVPPRVNDIACLELDFLIDLKLSVTHADGELFRSQKSVERQQTRWTAVMAMEHDVVTAVAVRFDRANETQINGNKPAPPADEPVAGKTYQVTRRGDKLVVTDMAGKKPPQAELDYLTKTMDAVGRPNALGRYLHGRELTVGKPIDVPAEVVSEIFGFRDAIGEVASLSLTLTQVHRTSSGVFAILDTKMSAHSPEEPKLQMRIAGQMQVEVDTCRLVGFMWEGPVSLSESRGAGRQAMKLQGDGTLAVEMRAKRAASWPERPIDYASSPSSSRK